MTTEPTAIQAQDAQKLLRALTAIRDGDFRYDDLPQGGEGTHGEITATVRELVDLLNRFAGELTRLARELGSEGLFGGQMEVPAAEGSWKDMVDNLNHMGSRLTDQVRSLSEVTHHYAEGGDSKRATVRCAGEMQELLQALNRVGERLQPR